MARPATPDSHLPWGDGLAVRQHTPLASGVALQAPTRPCYEQRPVTGVDANHSGTVATGLGGSWNHVVPCCNRTLKELRRGGAKCGDAPRMLEPANFLLEPAT